MGRRRLAGERGAGRFGILTMSQQSKNKKLAWDLMKCSSLTETTTREYFKRTGLLPMVKSQYKDAQYDTLVREDIPRADGDPQEPQRLEVAEEA